MHGVASVADRSVQKIIQGYSTSGAGTLAHSGEFVKGGLVLAVSDNMIFDAGYENRIFPITVIVLVLESVRKHQAGLQSFRRMGRIEASRRNASALRLRFSQSFASLRQRLSQAKVRSTIQRRGSTTNPFVRSERLTISVS